jgi:beta-barrel assembly-enhancing protease
MRVHRKRLRKKLSIVLLLVFFGSMQETSFGVIQAGNFKPGFNFFSRDTDIQEGQKAAAEVNKQLPLINDPAILNYVNELGRRLATVAPNNYNYPWTFKVVNSSDINAFALPGGFIYVNRATIEAAESEAQLAGVIAHEEGHVVMRHGTHRASEIALAKFPLAIVGGALGSSQLAQLGIGFGLNSILLHNSRSAEAQADQVGAYIAYHAGYNPRAMAEFFEIIEKKYPQRTLEFFSDHPNPEHRIQKVDAEIQDLGPSRQWRAESPEFRATKDRLLRMPAAPKVKTTANATPDNGTPPAAPSARLKSYQGEGFAIKYPANWQISESQDNVVLAPKGAVWSDPQNGSVQAYGASISRSPSAAKNLEDDTRQLLDSLQRSNPNIHVIEQKRVSINGRPALRTWFENDSPLKGQKESDQLVTLESGSILVTLVFITPQSALDSYKPAFEEMLRSLSVG